MAVPRGTGAVEVARATNCVEEALAAATRSVVMVSPVLRAWRRGGSRERDAADLIVRISDRLLRRKVVFIRSFSLDD